MKKLKGQKFLIIGNHDTEDTYKSDCLIGVDKMHFVNDNGNKICMCHFPLAEWNGYYKGAWHIYGHIHNSRNQTYNIMSRFDKALMLGV